MRGVPLVKAPANHPRRLKAGSLGNNRLVLRIAENPGKFIQKSAEIEYGSKGVALDFSR